MVLSYEEYKHLGGELSDTAFSVFGFEAEAKIKLATHGRITDSEAVKMCIVRICDILSKADISKDKVKSWSNDGVSETAADISLADYESQVRKIIHEYLANEVDRDGVSLLYLGGVLYD